MLRSVLLIIQSWYSLKLESAKNEEYWLMRVLLFRGLGFIYLCVFFPLLHQYKALIGKNGLLPIASYLEKIERYLEWPAWDWPTLFWLNTSDTFALGLIWFKQPSSLSPSSKPSLSDKPFKHNWK